MSTVVANPLRAGQVSTPLSVDIGDVTPSCAGPSDDAPVSGVSERLKTLVEVDGDEEEAPHYTYVSVLYVGRVLELTKLSCLQQARAAVSLARVSAGRYHGVGACVGGLCDPWCATNDRP